MKVSLRDLNQIAKQARNERGQKLFQFFRQEENVVHIASRARWDPQLKGLVELERRCQELMREVEPLSERQEVLAGLNEDEIRTQSASTSIGRRLGPEFLASPPPNARKIKVFSTRRSAFIEPAWRW